jgi:chromosomal replication initiation ATPase DnaA
MQQLTFPMGIENSCTEPDFYPSPSHEDAILWLQKWQQLPGLILCGPAKSGKSHLGRIWLHHAKAQAITPAMLVANPTGYTDKPLLFDWNNLVNQTDPDIGSLSQSTIEEALFHFFNGRNNQFFLFIGQDIPTINLPDLSSRLKTIPHAIIKPPTTETLRMLCLKRAQDYQWHLSPLVLDYLMVHIPRSFTALDHILGVLDQASLRDQRALTIPYVKSLIDQGELGLNKS